MKGWKLEAVFSESGLAGLLFKETMVHARLLYSDNLGCNFFLTNHEVSVQLKDKMLVILIFLSSRSLLKSKSTRSLRPINLINRV